MFMNRTSVVDSTGVSLKLNNSRMKIIVVVNSL